MLQLGPENAIAYLRAAGALRPGEAARAELLSGGVSNVVLRIRTEPGPGFVLKQSRERLRTAAAWFSRLDRIWREADAMRDWLPSTPPGFVPRVLFEDRANYVFAMETVPDGHTVWKEELLSGLCDVEVARQLGHVLQVMHAVTAAGHDRDRYRNRYGDREVFVQLRVDPFYRRIAEVQPELREPLAILIKDLMQTQCCLVHGDVSPKNVLVVRGGSAPEYFDWFDLPPAPGVPPRLTLVDYEVVHYGDPAFDVGFFLSHLLLKAVRRAGECQHLLRLARAFWDEYCRLAEADWRGGEVDFAAHPGQIERRAVPHAAACMLARIDGTSRIDYLPEPERQQFVRQLGREVLLGGAERLEEVFDRLEARLDDVNWN